MRTRTIHILALGLGLVTVLGGCETSSLATAPDGLAAEELSTLLASAAEDGSVFDTATDSATAGRLTGETADRPTHRPGRSVVEQLAEKIPSFGGLYRTERCAVVVVLTDMSEAERAIEIVKSVVEPLVQRGCPEGIRVQAVEGNYTYGQLLRIRHALRPLHVIPGVVGARIDFKQNKVIVGVRSREVFDEVRRALARIGLPADAVGVEVVNRLTR